MLSATNTLCMLLLAFPLTSGCKKSIEKPIKREEVVSYVWNLEDRAKWGGLRCWARARHTKITKGEKGGEDDWKRSHACATFLTFKSKKTYRHLEEVQVREEKVCYLFFV